MDTPVYKWDLSDGNLTPKNAIGWLEQKGYAASEWHDYPGSVYNDFVHEMDEIV